MRLNYITCEVCKGRGKFLGSECKVCRGRGQIAVMVPDDVSELVNNARSEGIREGISIAFNAIEKSKDAISAKVSKSVIEALERTAGIL